MKVIKKLGYRAPYDISKIKIALQKTAKDIDSKFTSSDWKELKPRILGRLEPIMKDREEIYFWEIDDVVIETLLRSRFNDITREYIQSKSTTIKDKLNDLGLSPHAMFILKERYLKKDSSGEPIETAKEMMCRVASAIASVEKNGVREKYTELFTKMLVNRDFLPNSPTLVSAGTKRKGTYSACFAYQINDSLDDIMNIVHLTAKTFQLGGGVGISIAKLREKGCPIETTNGFSSGSVEFLNLFDVMCSTIKTGGFRRGALMCLTEYNHPDIEWFIHCKKDTSKLNNMNISVMVNNDFIDAVKNDKDIDLISPKSGKIVDNISANLLLEHMATNIWETGEPGILFYNRINKDNPTPHLGDIRVVNPCLSGDTLIATANGSYEQIKNLIGKEIDVYSYDGNKIVKSTARNIRKTRENTDVYKITFTDNSTLKCTGDHPIMLRNGDYKLSMNLTPSDSIMPFSRYQYNARKHGKYWGIMRNNGKWIQEHNLICDLDYDSFNDVVHHKNFNGLDNSKENLQVMTISEHQTLHKVNMLGDNNPMRDKWWNKIPEEEKEEYRKKMSKLVSGKNNPNYKGIMDLPKPEKFIYRVCLQCPHCGKDIFIRPSSDVKGYCSISCYNKDTKTGKYRYTLEDILNAGINFIKEFKKLPVCNIWDRYARSNPENIPSRESIRVRLGGFKNFREALGGNHVVTSVEYIGKEDVYDMTVDNYHNFAVITNPNDKTERKGMPKHSGVIVHNCAESTLISGEACNLGSVNLVNHMTEDMLGLDWDKFAETIKLSIRFLDNMIDASPYPSKSVEKAVKATRKVGLGVMGFADMLIHMGIRYSSKEGVDMVGKVISFLTDVASQESKALGEEKGLYNEYKDGYRKRRNAIVSIQAPTGTLSLIAGVSPGIEPNFYSEYSRMIDNKIIHVTHPLSNREVFETAHKITPMQHLLMLAEVQKYIENSCSKTINAPEETTVSEIKELIMKAHELNCKGVTIFRNNCSREALIRCEDCKV